METREDRHVEKKLSRIDRWLKRCAAACRCGSWNSALLEIECMEAETKGFREELWSIAAREAVGQVRRPLREKLFSSLRVVALASVMVMAIGFPLSMDQDAPFRGFSNNSVALLTSTESDILDALRESLSNQNASRVILTIERTEGERPEKIQRGAAAAEDWPDRVPAARIPAVRNVKSPGPENLARAEEGKGTAAASPATQVVAAKEPSVEEVISLIQVGQRALRISEPAVKILP